MGKQVNKGQKEVLDLRELPLNKKWLAEQLGMSRVNLYHSMRYGFTKEQAVKVREIMQNLGVELLKYRVPIRVIRAYTEFLDDEEE